MSGISSCDIARSAGFLEDALRRCCENAAQRHAAVLDELVFAGRAIGKSDYDQRGGEDIVTHVVTSVLHLNLRRG